MSNQKEVAETFCVHVNGIVYSAHAYYRHAIKMAMNIGSIFPDADIEVVSDSKPPTQAAA